jgi:hypothetical protein
VGTRAGMDAMARRKIPCLCRESNPGRPSRSLVTILTELTQLCFALRNFRLRNTVFTNILLHDEPYITNCIKNRETSEKLLISPICVICCNQ